MLLKEIKIMKTNQLILGLVALALFSCQSNEEKADAYGNFEAVETTVSAESNGKLLQFNVDEGEVLKSSQTIGYVDTIPLHLQKELILSSQNVIKSKSRGVLSQINILKTQLKTAELNQKRVEKLFNQGATTQQKLDDVNGKVDVIKEQIHSIEIQNSSVLSELKNTNIQIDVINDKILKSIIKNPVDGTVLVKYVEPNEVVNFGKPLYKIANLNTLRLRVYLSENQLTSIKIGQQVEVKVDVKEGMKSYKGTVSWISSEAEFTPKVIQTKEERVNLVYALIIDVVNDGSLKIGMPAEMWLTK
jgi:HlyD family secretion protein